MLTPVKNQFQTIVDRRFEEAPDPQRPLRTMVAQANSFADVADVTLLLQRYLEAATAAFGARGASVDVALGAERRRLQHGDLEAGAALTADLNDLGVSFGTVALAPRPDGRPYTTSDEETLRTSAQSVARVVGLRGH